MTTPNPNWRAIAERVASRLADHAFCDEHPTSKPGHGCPHCNDRTTYAEYLAAGGYDYRVGLAASDGSITLDELRKQHEESS